MPNLSIFSATQSIDCEPLTMSTREIAELTGSTHDNVLKTVRALVKRGVVFQNETLYTHPQNGQQYPEFLLNYRDSMVVVSGYSPELRAKIIDRWQELETGKAKPAMVKQDTGTSLLEASESLIAMHQAGVLGKREAADMYRAAMLSKFHGAEVLMRAAMKKPKASLQATQTQLALPNSKAEILTSKDADRDPGTDSMTNLLKHGGFEFLTAQAVYKELAKRGMLLRGFRERFGQSSAHWVIIGDGLSYGQNVAREGYTMPYWYVSTFGFLAEKVGFHTMNRAAAQKKGFAV